MCAFLTHLHCTFQMSYFHLSYYHQILASSYCYVLTQKKSQYIVGTSTFMNSSVGLVSSEITLTVEFSLPYCTRNVEASSKQAQQRIVCRKIVSSHVEYTVTAGVSRSNTTEVTELQCRSEMLKRFDTYSCHVCRSALIVHKLSSWVRIANQRILVEHCDQESQFKDLAVNHNFTVEYISKNKEQRVLGLFSFL